MSFRTSKFVFAAVILLCGFVGAKADWHKRNLNTFAYFRDIFFVNQSKGFIVGSDGVIMTSEDGGATWSMRPKFTTDAFLQVYFTDENTGWLLCERNVFNRGNEATSYLRKTTDGGRNWEKIEFEDAGRERVTKLLFRKDGGARAFGEAGIFYKLQDDGLTWKRYRTAIHYLLLDGAYSDNSIGAIVGAGGTIMFTEDSGLTWDKATLLGEADTRFNAVYFGGAKEGAWAVGSKGRIFHSTGGARLWRQQQSTVTADLNDVTFTDAANGWAVGENGIIVRTRDGGKSWFDVRSNVTHSLQRVFFNNDRGWAIGFGGTLLYYNDLPSVNDTNAKPTLQKRT
jgi:photosystem II stability/assembly factor-like uncharacterized protein